MRLRVDGGGYATARTAFEDANHVAAMQYDALTGKLAAYVGMAGDDGSSAEFAAAYDEAATQATGALADLVDALASLGYLTAASLANHRDANVASIIAGAHVYDGTAVSEGSFASVLPATPPSALGAGVPDLPYPLGLLVDALDGFVWPNADVDRLRDAAHTWRSTAESVEGLRSYCDAAIRGLETQESPEIQVALDAITELQGLIGSTVDQYVAMATSCDAYAATVEAKRAEVVALAHEVLRMLAEEAALTIGLGLVTAGIGAVGKGGTAVARVAAYAPRFAAIIASLRAAAAGTAATIRSGTSVLRGVRDRLVKYVDVLHKRSVMRGEAGSIGPRGRRSTWLEAHERAGGHFLAKHAGKTDEEIIGRFAAHPTLKLSSTFTDEATAAWAIGRLLSRRRHDVAEWLQHGQGKLELDGDASRIIGRVAQRDSGEITESSRFRAVLVPDSDMPEGWKLLTAIVRR